MNKKLILIIGGVVFLLAAGGGGAAFLLMPKQAAAEAPKHAAEPEPPPPAPVAAPKGVYVKLEPMSAPLPPGAKGGRRQMMVLFELEVAAKDNLPKVQALVPRIRDTFIVELVANPIGTANGWEQDDIEAVKRRLLAQAERITGPGVLSEVLVVQAVRIGG